MKDFRQELYKNGYFRQEELCFADCDRYQRARVSGLLNKAAAYAGYDYNARGLTCLLYTSSPVVNYAMDLADVSGDAYYAEAVRWALSQGITTGTADGRFAPDATCTRAQGMTFLFRASKASADGAPAFSDVAADAYYAEAVKWATDNGITNGTTSSTFSPGSGCTRAQIVTFLWRLYADCLLYTSLLKAV